jgi:hypothetical protein
MLGRLRSTLPVRTAVCLAAIMSLAGSAGLHAEPSGSRIAGPQTGSAVFGGVGSVGTAHLCQLCVAYSACSLAPAGPTAPAVLAAEASPVPPQSSAGRVEAHQHDGRAPPLAS